MRTLEMVVVWFNRVRNRMASERYPAENVLLLLPHCLQNKACKEPVKDSLLNCKGCGRCRMKELRALAERMGVPARVAAGGREALEYARRPEVKAILAVACSRELAEGIRGAFPKRVIGILNSWPNGACKDTDVDVARVEIALNEIIAKSR